MAMYTRSVAPRRQKVPSATQAASHGRASPTRSSEYNKAMTASSAASATNRPTMTRSAPPSPCDSAAFTAKDSGG